ALAVSLLGNAAIFSVVGIVALAPLHLRDRPRPAEPEPPASLTLSPEMFERVPEAGPAAGDPPAPAPAAPSPDDPQFARTSEDQRGKRPARPGFIGERDTEATSDRAPVAGAPPLPSQKGR